MNINLLTTDTIYSRALSHKLHERTGISINILVERKKKKAENLIKKTILDGLGKEKYLKLSNFLWPDDFKKVALWEYLLIKQAESKFLKGNKVGLVQWPTDRVHVVENINSLDTQRLIKEINPDYSLVFGTGILKKNVIECSGDILNFHSSLLPEYRGVFPEFWQIYNQEFGSVGYTIHLIDEGIDTGDILFQEKCSLRSDNPFQLRIHNVMKMMDMINDILSQYEMGLLKPLPQGPTDKKTNFYSKITNEKKHMVYSRAVKKIDEKR